MVSGERRAGGASGGAEGASSRVCCLLGQSRRLKLREQNCWVFILRSLWDNGTSAQTRPPAAPRASTWHTGQGAGQHQGEQLCSVPCSSQLENPAASYTDVLLPAEPRWPGGKQRKQAAFRAQNGLQAALPTHTALSTVCKHCPHLLPSPPSLCSAQTRPQLRVVPKVSL